MTGKPVFFDPTGRRGCILAGMARALGTISALVTGLFVATWWSWIARCGASRFFNAASLDPLRLGADLLASICA
jgi:hypothetical protein